MKYFWMILALGIVGGGIFCFYDKSAKEARAEAYRRAEIERQREEAREKERQEKKRQEDERIRKERMEAVAKEDSVRLLHKYIAREEERLSDTVEECKIKLQMISVDQQSLSDELAALEREEENKAADAKRRKVKRRDKNERVDALLSSPTLNRLASTYLGEDLMAARAKFRSEVGNLVKMSDEKTRRYAENRKKYQQTIKESEEKVSRLTSEATRSLKEARARLGANVETLRARVERFRKDIAKLEAKERVTTLNMTERKNLESWRTQLEIAEAQLTSAEATAGLGTANKAHLDVTVAETTARRAGDAALSVRMDDDNAVEEEMNREIAIYNRATVYEQHTLDRIRDAMQHNSEIWAVKLSDAEKKLKYLGTATANIDFLNAEEVADLRKAITKKLNENITFVVEE